ncbi:MAG: xanthine dehydrogenase molybdopterin binding subunit, partial [Pseudomonadota bacterium]
GLGPDGLLQGLQHADCQHQRGLADRPAVFNAALWAAGENREPTVHRSKAVGEPPLMLAISVLQALQEAVWAETGRPGALLDAPATPERILLALDAPAP